MTTKITKKIYLETTDGFPMTKGSLIALRLVTEVFYDLFEVCLPGGKRNRFIRDQNQPSSPKNNGNPHLVIGTPEYALILAQFKAADTVDVEIGNPRGTVYSIKIKFSVGGEADRIFYFEYESNSGMFYPIRTQVKDVE